MYDDLIDKFHDRLRIALKNKIFNLPTDIKVEYAPISAYRAVDVNDIAEGGFNPEAFYSQVELKYAHPNMRRFVDLDENDIENYSCSLYTDIDKLNNYMHLPRKSKAVIFGKIISEEGVTKENFQTTHVHWWLFQGVHEQIGDRFEVISYEKK